MGNVTACKSCAVMGKQGSERVARSVMGWMKTRLGGVGGEGEKMEEDSGAGGAGT